MSESGDKPQTTAGGLRAEPTIVVKEKDWSNLKADLVKSQQALWEIARRSCLIVKYEYGGRKQHICDQCEEIINIARNARKGGK